MATKLTESELQALGFAPATTTTTKSEARTRVEYKGLPMGTPVDFTRKGVEMQGVIAQPCGDGRATIVYAHGDVWGALVVFDENNVREAHDKKAALKSGRTYCKREMESLALDEKCGFNVDVNRADVQEIMDILK